MASVKGLNKLASKISDALFNKQEDVLKSLIKENNFVGFSVTNPNEVYRAAKAGEHVAPKLVRSEKTGSQLFDESDFIGTPNKDGTFNILPKGIFSSESYAGVDHVNSGAQELFKSNFKSEHWDDYIRLKDIHNLIPAKVSAEGNLIKKGQISVPNEKVIKQREIEEGFKKEAGGIPEKTAPEPPKSDTSSDVPPKNPPPPPSKPPEVPPKGEGQSAPGTEGTPSEPPPQAKMKQEQQEKLQQEANESKNPPPNEGANNGVGGNSTAGQADNAKKRAGNKNPGAEDAQEGENQPGFFQRHWKATAATVGVGGLATCVGIANMMLAGGQQSNSNLYNPYQQQY